MTSALGLPPFVITFLRHMEPYHDYMKWTIGESSHKVSLTLSWNFSSVVSGAHAHDNHHDSSLFNKLNKSLSIAQLGQHNNCVPLEVSHLLQTLPKKHRRARLRQRITTTLGAIKSTLSMSRSSLDDLDAYDSYAQPQLTAPAPAAKRNHAPRQGAASNRPPLTRNNSFHGYASHPSTKASSLSYSPTRSTECSLPGGASSEADTCYSADELDYISPSDHVICFPAGFMYTTSGAPNQSPQRAIVAYRSTPDIGQALPDDFMDNTCADKRRAKSVIPEPESMERTILDWSKIVTGRHSRPTPLRKTVMTNSRAPTATATQRQPPVQRQKPTLIHTRSTPLALESPSQQSVTLRMSTAGPAQYDTAAQQFGDRSEPHYSPAPLKKQQATLQYGERPPPHYSPAPLRKQRQASPSDRPPPPHYNNTAGTARRKQHPASPDDPPPPPPPHYSPTSTTQYKKGTHVSTTFYAEPNSVAETDTAAAGGNDVSKCLVSCNKILTRYETEIT